MRKLLAPIFWIIEAYLYHFSKDKYWKDQRAIHKGLSWRDRSNG